MKTKILVVLVFFFAGLSVYFASELQSERYRFIDRISVPHIELNPVMLFYGIDKYQGEILISPTPGTVAYGDITGFVKLIDESKQPSAAWQYYTIIASENYDENGNQIFILRETLKLPYVAPRTFEDEELFVVRNSANSVVLQSEAGLHIMINKETGEVFIDHNTSDAARLITRELEYIDFMKPFLIERWY